MRQKSRKYLIKLGLFASIGTLLLILAIYYIGEQKNLFRANINISSIYQSVQGLKVGSDVRLTGVNVGVVNDIEILSDTAVKVEMLVDKDVIQFIKKDSRTAIGSDGLMGNKIINILPGSPDLSHVEQGDQLQSVQPVEIDDIIKEVKKSTEKINNIAENMISITSRIDRGEGVFGKIFTDTAFTGNLDRTSENITAITQNLIDISDRVNEGKGILGKLMVDTTITKELDDAGESLSRITENIEDITFKINHGEGIFGQLFVDTTVSNRISESTKNIRTLTDNLLQLSENMQKGEGTISKLVNDTAFADSLDVILHNLNEGIKTATDAADAIQRSGLIRLFSKDKKKEKE